MEKYYFYSEGNMRINEDDLEDRIDAAENANCSVELVEVLAEDKDMYIQSDTTYDANWPENEKSWLKKLFIRKVK